MMSYKGKGWNQLVDEISKDFLLKLPELSQDWESPTFAVNLGWDFISVMYKEIFGEPRDIYWSKYYKFRGINPQSTQYVLPTQLNDVEKEEYKRKRSILDENLVQAVWPMIKSGERPLQSGVRRFINNMKGSGGTDDSDEMHIWYCTIRAMFHDWYSHVYKKYIDKYQHSNPDTYIKDTKAFERALSTYYSDAGEKQTLPTWFNMQCLNWWLSWQQISLKPNEIKELYIQAGLAKTLYDI